MTPKQVDICKTVIITEIVFDRDFGNRRGLAYIIDNSSVIQIRLEVSVVKGEVRFFCVPRGHSLDYTFASGS